ncbi:MAG: deoxyguanosinetriphosphate triphosphohydrolase [Planctomycetota bacterium]
MFLNREQLEEREEKILAQYAVLSKYSKGREYQEKEHCYRTAFQRDRDRIVHSNAFRRLEYKTQVFVNHEGDYFRNRLTHTLEASSIGRTIAKCLAVNEDLTECIILAHDLGHPPFGHAGENALNQLLQNEGGFDHNSQAIRVVEFLETPYPDFRGLNLSWEVREALRKHSKNYKVEEKFLPAHSPPIEAQIATISDDIAWAAHDIDDSLKSNLVKIQDLIEIPLIKEIYHNIIPSQDPSILRKQIVRRFIDVMVTDVLYTTSENIKKNHINSLQEVRKYPQFLVSFSQILSKKFAELNKFLYTNFYNHYKLVAMAEKAKFFIIQLFNAYKNNPKQLPPQFYALLNIQSVDRTVADYICGMTDRYAQEEYKRLFYPFEKL